MVIMFHVPVPDWWMDWSRLLMHFIRRCSSRKGTMTKSSPPAEHARATPQRTLVVCLILLLGLFCVMLAAAVIGSESLPVAAALRAVLTGGKSASGLTAEQRAILMDIRLPRILLAAAVGMSLAAA